MILYPATSLPQFSRSVVTLDGLLLGVEMDGVAWVFDTLSGWTLGGGVTNSFAERPGAHGEFDGPTYRRARIVNISGVCIADTPLLAEQAAEALASVMADGRLGSITVDSPLRTLSASVRLSDTPQAEWLSDNAFRWALQFTAPDPRKYDLPSILTTGLPSADEAGMRFPAFFPLAFDVVGETATRRNACTNPQPVNLAGWSSLVAGEIVPAPDDATRTAYRTRGNGSGTAYAFAPLAAGTWNVGDVVTLSAWVMAPAGVKLRPRAHGRTGNIYWGGTSVSAEYPDVIATGAPQRISVTRTMTEATSSLDLAILIYNSTGGALGSGEYVHVWNVQYAPGAALDPYGDGASAATADGTWRWDGTAGASASTFYAYQRADVISGGRVALSNSGTASSEPVLTVSGSFPSGFQVTHVETGARLRYEAPAVGEYVLDAREGRVSIDDQDRSGALTVREWPSVPPGASATFALSAIGDPALASGSLTVTLSPAFY